MKPKGKPYRGILAKPIVLPLPDHWSRQRKTYGQRKVHVHGAYEQRVDEFVRNSAERERLAGLFAHFEILPHSPEAWRELAVALARTHVPGFQAVRAQGAPVTRDTQVKYQLYLHARRKRNGRKVSDRAVCEWLAKDPAFKQAVPDLAHVEPKRLANLLSEANSLRRASILHRWERRAVLRRLTDMSPDEVAEATLGLFGDGGLLADKTVAYWPRPLPSAFKKPSRKG